MIALAHVNRILGLALLITVLPGLRNGAAAAPDAPTLDQAFWRHWSDGQAELAAYDLTYPRYGESRRGTAVTIFVKEDFANSTRVKANPDHAPADTFPVMKLNLVQDFPTGVYDYNMMTSTFVPLQPVNGRPAGAPTKVAFSAQEWCGQVYEQLLFDEEQIRETLHSYFDGEADRTGTLEYPRDGIAEDVLLFWARGMAGPALAPGASVRRPLLPTVERARLTHQALEWQSSTFARAAERRTATVPAGTFEVDVYTVRVGKPEREVTIFVEAAAPRRVVRWESSEGYRAELLGSKRLKYWQMKGAGFTAALGELGLQPRGPRTP